MANTARAPGGVQSLRLWRYVAPGLAASGVVLGIPMVFSLWVATHRYLLREGAIGEFTGVGNFVAAFADERFVNAVANSGKLALAATTVPVLIALVLGTALVTPRLRFRNTYLAILMIPLFMPMVGSGLVWLLILHPQQGIFNYLVGLIGVEPFPWLQARGTALWTVAAIDSWQQTSLVTLLIFAGLLSVPSDSVQAARIDGAGAWQVYRYITLPLLRPTIITAAMIRLIMSVLTYDLVYVLTQGGPGISSEVLPFYIGRIAFRHLDLGYASALSWILLFLIACVVSVAILASKRAD